MSTDTEMGPRYVVMTHSEYSAHADRPNIGRIERKGYGYYIVDTTGASPAVWQNHRVDAQGRADRWNRNAAKETK